MSFSFILGAARYLLFFLPNSSGLVDGVKWPNDKLNSSSNVWGPKFADNPVLGAVKQTYAGCNRHSSRRNSQSFCSGLGSIVFITARMGFMDQTKNEKRPPCPHHVR